MIIRFEKEYLSELYYDGKSRNKKYRFQPQVVRNYVKRIITLAEIKKVEELYEMNSLNYEVLKGDKKGISSLRIDRQYRLEFTITIHDSGEEVINVCSILDISNHCKT